MAKQQPGKWQNRYFRLGVCFVAVAVLLLFLPSLGANKDFEVTFLDVGQGDCILVSCQGKHVLIDGGGSPHNVTGVGENVVVPYLKSQGINQLDCVFNSHPDADHIGGLFPVLDQLEVTEVWKFPNYQDVHLNQQLLALSDSKGVPVTAASSGMIYQLTPDCSIMVVAPGAEEQFDDDSTNEGSLVLKISYRDFDILAVGDLQGAEQEALLRFQQDPLIGPFDQIEVLQIPHHGSKNSYDEEWYQAFAPQAVVVSVGKDNMYGHPFAGVAEYWQKREVKVLRTDLDGSIKITTDGRKGHFEAVKNLPGTL